MVTTRSAKLFYDLGFDSLVAQPFHGHAIEDYNQFKQMEECESIDEFKQVL